MRASRWEVVVIGAGPAGALAAREAARGMGGRGVLLVDKARFPRDKVCGCCLSGAAMAVLDDVGLGGLVSQSGGRALTHATVALGRRRLTLALPRACVLSRAALDHALVRSAVAAGAIFRDGTMAEPLERRDETSVLRIGDERMEARWLVVAEGLGGRLLQDDPAFAVKVTTRSRLGAHALLDACPSPSGLAEGGVLMVVGRGGYVGLTRLEDGRLDVAAAWDARALREAAGPAALARRLLAESEVEGLPGLEAVRWRGTVHLTRRRPCVAAPGVLVVGDAAGYVEPFTGEGIGWAMASGAMAGRLLGGGGSRAEIAAAWPRLWRRALADRRVLCSTIAAVLRRPRLAAAALVGIRGAPMLADVALRRIHGRINLETHGHRRHDHPPHGRHQGVGRPCTPLLDRAG